MYVLWQYIAETYMERVKESRKLQMLIASKIILSRCDSQDSLWFDAEMLIFVAYTCDCEFSLCFWIEEGRIDNLYFFQLTFFSLSWADLRWYSMRSPDIDFFSFLFYYSFLVWIILLWIKKCWLHGVQIKVTMTWDV